MLAIAAQIPSPELGSEYFQETHPDHLFAQCSHYCELVSNVYQMPRILKIAMQTAISRRGVAVIAMSGDVGLREAVEQQPRLRFPVPEPDICPFDNEIAELAKLFSTSKKITIFGGAGCARVHPEFIALAAKLKVPIVHAMRGKEFTEYDNPFDVGMTTLIVFSSGYHAMLNCDVLLMIGTDFPYQQFFPKEATIVQIDIRGEQLGRRTKIDYGYVGDTKTTLLALLPTLLDNKDEEHLKASVEHYLKTWKDLEDLAIENSSDKHIHPQYVAKVLDELVAKDAIFSCDVGTPTIWAARYLTMNGTVTRIVHSWIHGERPFLGN